MGTDVLDVLMVLLQQQHVWCVRGMRIKSEESHAELGEGDANDLEHTYT